MADDLIDPILPDPIEGDGNKGDPKENPDGGDGGNGREGGDDGDEFPPWMAQNQGDNKKNERLKKFKVINELSDEYIKIEDKLKEISEGKVFIPGNEATEEEKKAYYKAIGVPETITEYKRHESLSDNGIQFTDKEFSGLAKIAQDNHYTNDQFHALQDWLVQTTINRAKYNLQVLDDRTKKAEATFREKWADKYDENVGYLKKGIESLGEGTEQLLNRTGFGDNPVAIDFLVKLGKMNSDDKLMEGNGEDDTPKKRPDQLYYPSMEGM